MLSSCQSIIFWDATNCFLQTQANVSSQQTKISGSSHIHSTLARLSATDHNYLSPFPGPASRCCELTFQILLSFICNLSQKEQNLTLREKAIFRLNEFKLDETCVLEFLCRKLFSFFVFFVNIQLYLITWYKLATSFWLYFGLNLILSFKICIRVQDVTVLTFYDIAFLE